MKTYIGTTSKLATHLVVAEFMPSADAYRVVYPEAESRVLPAIIFEELYREITWHERLLIEQTDAEHQVSAISDGQPEHCEHEPGYDVTVDETYCQKCLERLPNDPTAPALQK